MIPERNHRNQRKMLNLSRLHSHSRLLHLLRKLWKKCQVQQNKYGFLLPDLNIIISLIEYSGAFSITSPAIGNLYSG